LPPNSRAPPTPRPGPPTRAGNAAPLIPQPAQAPPGHSAGAKPRPADFRRATGNADEGTRRIVAIRDRWPDAVVISEETADTDAAIREQLGTEEAVVLDPLDGTKNFVSGLPLFAVIRRGRIVGGLIHDR
jgi:hypothetical protein